MAQSTVTKSDPINFFESLPEDLSKHVLSFSAPETLASYARTSKSSYILTNQYHLDFVKDIAWFDRENHCWHIKPISSTDKSEISKDLMTMTCNGDENSKQYLLTPSTHDSFKWSMFVARTLRGPELSETRGYWKILYRENNEKYASRDDLTRIRSLVLHQQIAPKLLDYKKKTAFESTNLNEDHPFKESFKVWLHTKSDSDSESDEGIIKYEVKFWNGASLNQTHAYKIVKIESGKTNYYQYFDASLKHDQIKWLWYDNNNSRYQYFELGPDTNQQLECSFQSNLIYNYPVNIHSDIDDGQYFNNCSLPYLRKGFSEYMEKNGEDISKLNYKTYLLRTTFHRQPREYRYIHMLEQVTVSEHAFPRTVQRRDHSITAKGEDERKYGVEDYCIDINRHYNLRMEPL